MVDEVTARVGPDLNTSVDYKGQASQSEIEKLYSSYIRPRCCGGDSGVFLQILPSFNLYIPATSSGSSGNSHSELLSTHEWMNDT